MTLDTIANAAEAAELERHALFGPDAPENVADLHDCDRHTEPSRACYVAHRCRCHDCTAANLDYYHRWNRRRLEQKHGVRRPVWIDADTPSRTLTRIREAGHGLRTISAATGLSRTSLYRLGRGDRNRVHVTTARKLAAYAQEVLA